MNLSKSLAERLKSVSKKSIEDELKEKRRETDLDWAYRQAASVLSSFSLDLLHPFGLSIEHDVRTYQMRLLQDCLPAGENSDRWTLKHPVRKAALSRLKTRNALKEALFAYPDRPTNLLQQTIEGCITDKLEPVDGQSLLQLQHTHQVIDWLSETGIASDLPEPEAVSRLIAWRQQLEPFQYLVGDHFRGRIDELDRLHEHVFVERTTPPLLIYGPGGTGKSTLLAKFILDATPGPLDPAHIPFTYIDFDRLVATPEEPLTLLMEAASQLAIQYPGIEEEARYFNDEWSYRLTATDTRSNQTQIAQKIDFEFLSKMGTGALRSRLDIYSGYIEDFARLLTNTGASPDSPFLFVLDTFEEVQFRSSDQVLELSLFFDVLRGAVPNLRVVIAGRGLIDEAEMDVKALELKEFDEAASVGFLTFKGIKSTRLAKEVFDLVGGNPLSLKLAADLVREEGLNVGQEAGLEELKAVLRRVEENNIQGQLYRRILEHIKNPEARKLAHPGLTLRFVSAELIKEVLADPCGLGDISITDAQRLFAVLQNEVSLVTPDPHRPDMLRHRPDVRAIMIQALQNDEPLVVHEIHSAAVKYYERFDDPAARAEEIYHSLFAGEDFAGIDKRWNPDWIEPLYQALRPALTEFPPPAQAYLAGRLGITGVAVDWNETDLRDWERLVRKRVEDLIYSGKFDDAYALVSERSERTVGSPLYYYETQILIQKKRWEEARRCVKEGLFSMRQAGNEEQLLLLLKQAIQIDMELRHYRQAKQEIEQARSLLKYDAEPQLTELEFGLHELQIIKSTNKPDADVVVLLENELLEAFERLSDRHLRLSPRVVRMMLAAFGDEDVDVLRRGLKIMTLGDPSQEQREAIGRAMAQWDALFSETNNAPPGSLLDVIGRPMQKGADLLESWMDFAASSKARELSEAIELLLDKFGDRALEAAPADTPAEETPVEEEEPREQADRGLIPPPQPEPPSAPAPIPGPPPPTVDSGDSIDATLDRIKQKAQHKSSGSYKRRAKKKRFDAGSIIGKSLSGSILDR